MAFFWPRILVEIKEDIPNNRILVKPIDFFVFLLSSTVGHPFRDGRDWSMPG